MEIYGFPFNYSAACQAERDLCQAKRFYFTTKCQKFIFYPKIILLNVDLEILLGANRTFGTGSPIWEPLSQSNYCYSGIVLCIVPPDFVKVLGQELILDVKLLLKNLDPSLLSCWVLQVWDVASKPQRHRCVALFQRSSTTLPAGYLQSIHSDSCLGAEINASEPD